MSRYSIHLDLLLPRREGSSSLHHNTKSHVYPTMLRHRTSHNPQSPHLFSTSSPPSILTSLAMTLRQELSSWVSPTALHTSDPPTINAPAPSVPNTLAFPRTDRRGTVITFLRHCGCPFAEKTFLSLRATAERHPKIVFIAISHSDQTATDHWLEALSGPGSVQVIVDAKRDIYTKWGLGVSGWWHVLSPGSMWSVMKLGRGEGIWNRPTESGSRWQVAGSWAVDEEGVIRWGGPCGRADEVPDFGEVVRSMGDTVRIAKEVEKG